MKTKIIVIISIIFLTTSLCIAQNFWVESGFNYGGQVYSLLITNNGNIFAGHSNGIYKSTDDGANWNRVYQPSIETISLAYNPTNSYVYAGLETTSSDQYGGIYRSTNQGASWGDYRLANKKITDIVVTTNGTVFACSPTDYPNGGVFKSTDNGNSWLNSLEPIFHTYCLAVDLNNNVYAGTDDPSSNAKPQIMKSTDNGITWDTLYRFDMSSPTYIKGIHITAGGIMFVHFSDKIFRSTDNGVSWDSVLNGVEHYDIVKFVSEDNRVFVSSYSTTGVYFSEDNGINWVPFNSNLGNSNVIPLVLDSESYLYAGANNRIFKTVLPTPVELISFYAITNGNSILLNWVTASELNNNGFEVERKNVNGHFELIGFVQGNGTTTIEQSYSYIDKNLSAGIYIYRLKQIDFDGSYEYSAIVEVEIINPNTYELCQNYPNPFNPATNINFVLPKKSFVILKIFDVLGNEVSSLVNEEKESGFYILEFDASNLPGGAYFYRIQAGEFIATKKMLVLK